MLCDGAYVKLYLDDCTKGADVPMRRIAYVILSRGELVSSLGYSSSRNSQATTLGLPYTDPSDVVVLVTMKGTLMNWDVSGGTIGAGSHA
jgi:hypothetical protein